MSSTTKSAVSDYEHLNYRSAKGNAIGINESDDDELFLKAPTLKALDSLTTFFNDNNNSSPIRTLVANNQLDRFDSVAVNNKIPVPSSWSPGMTLHPNPALLITPEKSVKGRDEQYNDHSLPSHSEKKAPQPVPWSPSMRPEKSIFITPEKTGIELKDNKDDAENMKNTKLYSKQFSTLTSQDAEKFSKERQTVRFDLPSLSSGDDTFFDENSNLFSPVIIKGTELSPESPSRDISEPPFPYASFESYDTKSYNPHIYSDDSNSEGSVLTSKRSLPQDTQSQTQHTNVSLSTSAHLVNKLKELMQDSDLSKVMANSQDSPIESQVQKDCLGAVDKITNSKLEKPLEVDTKVTKEFKKRPKESQNSVMLIPSRKRDLKSSEVFVIKENQNNSKSVSLHKQIKSTQGTVPKMGPHFLKNPIPAYHPPSSGSCIVKEPHHKIDSQNYAYPFQDDMKETENFTEIEHAFARPEFNSTLKFRQALDNLCEQEIDIVKAVNEKFQLTADKKTEILEKAAHLTNCPSDQFANLVDLDPPVDRLCDRILKMRTSKTVKKKKKPSQKAAKTPTNVPDLMEFFSPELQKEMPGVSLHGITLVTSDLLSASNDLAFDVYKHNRMWEGIHDF